MADTERTEATLLSTLFQDGQAAGSITAQDMRDLIVTLCNRKMQRTTYNDYVVSAYQMRGGASSPTLTAFRGNIYSLAYTGSGASVNETHFAVHILHDIKAGTNITFHVHWSHIVAAPSGNVKWSLEYTIAKGYGTTAFAAPTTLTTTQTAGAQYVHHITNDDDMTITTSTNLEPDAIIICRLYRDPADAADTFANDAYVFSVDAHYQVGQAGTTERNRSFTSMGFS